MRTINFKEVEIKGIDGTPKTVDIARDMANVLYYQTNSIAAVSVALDIYKTGCAELDAETAVAVKAVVKQNFTAIVQLALNPILEDIINGRADAHTVQNL
ncbi:hypothetical protein [Prevotella sp. kh1p2]|uniref:hypothetical protein n=1 Tax=Prevotella sp. kh1p2 TaxID=1761883 RepID=UPI0008B4C057|nr:hypothetical protein [Prevotella sp. kh1p2]SES89161.1 hypothetical protein SAMN04487825_10752 [Prevotella sp. kh1p2]SNU11687.1 hypothetical protein SAMN06298210_112108 [Prevotellaceae bacterium KH2P17]